MLPVLLVLEVPSPSESSRGACLNAENVPGGRRKLDLPAHSEEFSRWNRGKNGGPRVPGVGHLAQTTLRTPVQVINGRRCLREPGRPEHSSGEHLRRHRAAMDGHYRGGPWGLIRGGVDRPELRFAWPLWRPSSWLAWLSEIGWPTTQPVHRAQVGRTTISPETTRRRHCRNGIPSSQRIFPTLMSCGRVKDTWRQQRETPPSTFSSPHPVTSCSGRSDPTCPPASGLGRQRVWKRVGP